jgi:hypothetical protein|tara:strand:+ start:1640 stop:1744 length:105 start_codon:yes stop_codon:yes gene_type:complete
MEGLAVPARRVEHSGIETLALKRKAPLARRRERR